MPNTYGTRVVYQLARDSGSAFSETQGFSARNLWRLRAFYLAHSGPKILPQRVAKLDEAHLPITVADLPLAHHVLPMERVKTERARDCYASSAHVRRKWG